MPLVTSATIFLNFPSSLSNQFVIINNDGTDAISGTFSSKPEGSTVSAGSESFRITYQGGDGNDVVLTQISGAFRPILNIERVSIDAVRLFWGTNNADGFALESNTSLAGTNWVTVSPAPSQQGSIYTVTNTIPPAENYYRLRK